MYATVCFGNCSAMKYAQFAVNCQKYANPLVFLMMNYFSNTAAKTAERAAVQLFLKHHIRQNVTTTRWRLVVWMKLCRNNSRSNKPCWTVCGSCPLSRLQSYCVFTLCSWAIRHYNKYFQIPVPTTKIIYDDQDLGFTSGECVSIYTRSTYPDLQPQQFDNVLFRCQFEYSIILYCIIRSTAWAPGVIIIWKHWYFSMWLCTSRPPSLKLDVSVLQEKEMQEVVQHLKKRLLNNHCVGCLKWRFKKLVLKLHG